MENELIQVEISFKQVIVVGWEEFQDGLKEFNSEEKCAKRR